MTTESMPRAPAHGEPVLGYARQVGRSEPAGPERVSTAAEGSIQSSSVGRFYGVRRV